MTDRRNTPPPSEAAARHLAQKGNDGIDQLQAIVDRARAMLASGEVAPPADGEDPHLPPSYPWEVTERRTDLPPRVWQAAVMDFATGEGMSNHFFATFAFDEDEVRRNLSRRIGRHLAHGAQVSAGVEEFPSASLFLSPALRSKLEAFDRGEDRPAVMSFLAQYHANYP